MKILKFIKENLVLSIGLLIVGAALFIAIFAPVIAPYDPAHMLPSDRLGRPFETDGHLLGCDYIGRDLLSRIMYGIRVSLLVSCGSVLLAAVLGAVIGLLSGLAKTGGVIDTVLMRITDVQTGFPFVIMAMIALSLFESTVFSVTIVLALATWPGYCRMVRSSAISQKNMDFINAVKVMGASKTRICTKYILRNMLPALIPTIPLDIAANMINESLLSYMSIGLNPPIISLGNIMADGQSYIASDWWLVGIPGIFIIIIVLGLNFIGDNLQVKLDPLLRK